MVGAIAQADGATPTLVANRTSVSRHRVLVPFCQPVERVAAATGVNLLTPSCNMPSALATTWLRIITRPATIPRSLLRQLLAVDFLRTRTTVPTAASCELRSAFWS
jgi:hypothetical protein